MMHFLRLIRIYNLLFIVFVQWMMQLFVLKPILNVYGIETDLSWIGMSILSLTSVLIAAAGYIINDYFDQKIDSINRPNHRIVGLKMRQETAMILHQIITIAGVIVGLSLSYFCRSIFLGVIFIAIPGGLWLYSASYKRQLMIGNVTISFIAALSVIVVGIYDMALLRMDHGALIYQTPVPREVYAWTGGFAFFSFFTTWIREIIKDMEDEFGDAELGCRTMPVIWGVDRTKLFLYLLITVTAVSMFLANYFWIDFEGTMTIRYIIIGLILPLAYLSYLIYKAKHSSEYHFASMFTKGIMLIGMLYSVIFAVQMAHKYGLSFWDII